MWKVLQETMDIIMSKKLSLTVKNKSSCVYCVCELNRVFYARITNDHRVTDLKQYKFIISRSVGQKCVLG